MFKKALGGIKTSAPLRSSDRRKLRQRVVDRFGLAQDTDDGDELVPDGLLVVKFTTHLGEPGVAYLSPDAGGDPLWFTLGKGQSDQLIPTVYTLWKRPNLIPSLSTPSPVIPVLVGGADLMVPGVVYLPPSLRRDDLVSITRYEQGKHGPPLAVGVMAIDGDTIKTRDGRSGNVKKGKAVHVLHTWNDALFDLGSKSDPPDGVPEEGEEEEAENGQEKDETVAAVEEGTAALTLESPPISTDAPPKSPEVSPQGHEVSDLLRTSLIHAIRTSLSSLPSSAFPMSSTILYSTHILPSRPASCRALATPVDIKHSTHKSLTAFLRVCDKEGLVKLKEVKSDVVVVATVPNHPDVLAHKPYESLRDVEVKREKREEREEAEKNKVKEMAVKQVWKPHAQTIRFFSETGNSTSALYSVQDIKSIMDNYVGAKGLVNATNGQYVDIDTLLAATLTTAKKPGGDKEVLKRGELVRMLTEKMQRWYEVSIEGKDPVIKKGQLKPISVVVKTRQGGRKATTTISNYESFMLSGEFLAEELRRVCACATSVTTTQTLQEVVVVQGKQTTAVAALLASRGVPKQWIEVLV